MVERFQDILDESIDSIISGRETVESCLAKRPDAGRELEPLLCIAYQSRGALKIEVPEGVREATREKVLAKAREMSCTGRAASRHKLQSEKRRFLLRPVAIVTALTVMLFAGTAVAATMSAPDNILYPLKEGLEEMRVAIAFDKLDKAGIEVGHAESRLDEIESMVDQNKPEYVQSLLLNYDSHMTKAITLVKEASEEGRDTAEMETVIKEVQERHDSLLRGLFDRVPDDVRDVLREAMRKAGLSEETGPMIPVPGHDPGAQGGQGDESQKMTPGGATPESGGMPGNNETGIPGPGHEEIPPDTGGMTNNENMPFIPFDGSFTQKNDSKTVGVSTVTG